LFINEFDPESLDVESHCRQLIDLTAPPVVQSFDRLPDFLVIIAVA
jgi:hypothetical protein